MRGQMQDHPLLISSLLNHASLNFRKQGIVSLDRDADGASLGSTTTVTYDVLARRTAKLANALIDLGVKPSDRIATLAWNDQRHFELYYAISGIGAVCHTINPRLFPDQLTYIVRHAADRWIAVDPTLLPVLEAVFDDVADVPEGIIVLSGAMPETPLAERTTVLLYENLIAPHTEVITWPSFDENSAAVMCYTSGTTGNPKGVLYSHRSTVLHAWSIALPDAVALSQSTVILPIVPMFHVNAWGTVYGAAMTGATMAMPGPRLDGQSLYELIEAAGVNYICGVPTVWLGLLDYLRKAGKKLPEGLRGVGGGSAIPRALIEAYWKEQGVRIDHGWGMTELSPVGAYNAPSRPLAEMSDEELIADAIKQGRAPYGVELKIIDEDENELPRDGQTSGELCVRGPWVTSGYYHDAEANKAAFTSDGWFKTGDVATIDGDGYIELVDRVKDLIKSGGEWISSIEVENLALTYPGIKEAAAVPARHKKWTERPIIVAVREEGASVDEEALREHLAKTLTKWMLPDAIVFVDELPHTATGKIMKRALRDDYADYLERHGLDN